MGCHGTNWWFLSTHSTFTIKAFKGITNIEGLDYHARGLFNKAMVVHVVVIVPL
jgi:hypothetical protein